MNTVKKAVVKAPGRVEEGPSFEKSLERLEKIVGEMEAGSLGLEDMIGRFEEGQKLIQFCSQKLNEVQRKIEVLVKEGSAVTTEPFEPADNEADEPADADEDEEEPDGRAPF